MLEKTSAETLQSQAVSILVLILLMRQTHLKGAVNSSEELVGRPLTPGCSTMKGVSPGNNQVSFFSIASPDQLMIASGYKPPPSVCRVWAAAHFIVMFPKLALNGRSTMQFFLFSSHYYCWLIVILLFSMRIMLCIYIYMVYIACIWMFIPMSHVHVLGDGRGRCQMSYYHSLHYSLEIIFLIEPRTHHFGNICWPESLSVLIVSALSPNWITGLCLAMPGVLHGSWGSTLRFSYFTSSIFPFQAIFIPPSF